MQAEALSNDTDTKVDALLQATTAKVTRISEVVKEFDDRQSQIDQALSNLDQRGSSVQETMASTIGKIESSIGQLHEGALLIQMSADMPVTKN